MTDKPNLIVNEPAFFRSLGLDPATIKPGTVAVNIEGGVPILSFTSIYNVPPSILAQAFIASDTDPKPSVPEAPAVDEPQSDSGLQPEYLDN